MKKPKKQERMVTQNAQPFGNFQGVGVRNPMGKLRNGQSSCNKPKKPVTLA